MLFLCSICRSSHGTTNNFNAIEGQRNTLRTLFLEKLPLSIAGIYLGSTGLSLYGSAGSSCHHPHTPAIKVLQLSGSRAIRVTGLVSLRLIIRSPHSVLCRARPVCPVHRCGVFSGAAAVSFTSALFLSIYNSISHFNLAILLLSTTALVMDNGSTQAVGKCKCGSNSHC